MTSDELSKRKVYKTKRGTEERQSAIYGYICETNWTCSVEVKTVKDPKLKGKTSPRDVLQYFFIFQARFN